IPTISVDVMKNSYSINDLKRTLSEIMNTSPTMLTNHYIIKHNNNDINQMLDIAYSRVLTDPRIPSLIYDIQRLRITGFTRSKLYDDFNEFYDIMEILNHKEFSAVLYFYTKMKDGTSIYINIKCFKNHLDYLEEYFVKINK